MVVPISILVRTENGVLKFILFPIPPRTGRELSPDPMFLQLLAFPLVQLLSQPTVPALVSCDLASANQQAASALLQQIEQDACATTAHPPVGIIY